MAGVSQLWGDVTGVAPVDGSLGGSGEEVGGIGSEGDGSAGSSDLALRLDEHLVGADLGNGAVAATDEEVVVGEEGEAVDTLGEESLGWADSLEEVSLEVDLDDVTGAGSKEAA